MLADLATPWSETYPQNDYPKWYFHDMSDLLYNPVESDDTRVFNRFFEHKESMHMSIVSEAPMQVHFEMYEIKQTSLDNFRELEQMEEKERVGQMVQNCNDLGCTYDERIQDIDLHVRAQKILQKSELTSEFLHDNPFLTKLTIRTKTGNDVISGYVDVWGVKFYKEKPLKSELRNLLLSCPWFNLRLIPAGPDHESCFLHDVKK